MNRLLTISIALLLVGCVPRTIVSDYDPTSAKDVVRGWADSYNRQDVDQLALLVHPQKRADFDASRQAFRGQIAGWQIQSFSVGDEVRVNNELKGREVVLKLTDGRRTRVRNGIIVETRGRWWVWRH